MAVELFVDTSAWYVLAVTSTPQHRRFAETLRARVKQGSRVVTTNLVIAETHVLLMRRISHSVAMTFVREVSRSPNIIVRSSEEHEAAAVTDWLERFDDQDFSFTDAVSFVVMTERGISEALALDHHFSSAGFSLLP